MGGSALSFETRRVKRDEYFHLVNDISCKLSSIGIKTFADIPAYRTKPDFGDIDILIVSDKPDRKKWIQDLFNPTEIFHNSDCFSFDYYGVQVDFIFSSPKNFVTSLYYFSWNDCGNLLGRVYHKMGLRFGHDGLTLMVRDDTQVIGEIELSKNIDEILEFAGYDPDVYHAGFDTKEEIFKFVVSSPYYNYEIFDLNNRNYRARTRDRKRPTYTEFLTWAQVADNISPDNGYEWNANKASYLPRILHTFGKLDVYCDLLKKHSRALYIKERFNGSLVMKFTGLMGKDLGAFMSRFRGVYSSDDILQMTPLMVQNAIETMFKE